MIWATAILFVFVSFLVVLYFLPYKMLKGKIFKKLYPSTAAVDKVVFKGKDFDVEFLRQGERWAMVSPVSWQADTEKMLHLMLRISELDVIDRFSGANAADSQYDIGRNGVLELWEGDKSTALEFGSICEDGESIYLVKSNDGDVLTVSSAILAVLPKSEDDFKRTRLFESLLSEINSAETVMDGKSRLMTRSDKGWILNGKNAFDESVLPMLEAIMNIRAEGFIQKDTQLPPKHSGFITVKGKGKAVSRYFFRLKDYENKYIVPMKGELLIVDKNSVKDVF